VDAENRAEGSVLKPADEQLAVGRVVRMAENEATNVRRPVGNPGKREVQPSGNLAAQALPIGVDVA
jgi:hypothetical protein